MASPRTIIIGAGRLGSTIARSLNKSSNVIVIDCSKEKIDRLGEYSGFVEVGDATDCSLLEKCGIKTADRVIAVTDDDNINVFLADLCTHIYHVPDITIRLKDSRKKVLVDERINCICPFDLSLDYFEKREEEVKE
ncbi:MAG: TrkA family potassium uptake protein [Erysipelotrichaceae bacterium]|jgi:trk system potassium uptake protein TrkA|nr:TrkA family potassium uptake protein [Erysipelotrichaceae bacterium]